MEDRDYLDAKFSGLEKLMEVQNKNLTEHIGAVSRNVKSLNDDLSGHKESSTAHGLESSNKAHHSIIAWLGLLIAGSIGVKEFIEAVRK